MKNEDQIREMAAAGLSAGAIADELGVSRQYIHQIAKRAGISLPHSTRGRVAPGSKLVVPRIQTGGVSAKVTHSVAGSIAELLVAADLMARGWRVFMPVLSSKGHDIIGEKEGRLVTFEVRSAQRNASGKLIYQKKSDSESEHYGLVVTGEPVAYDPPLPDIDEDKKVS